MSSAGPIESFVFEFEAYCVNGHVTQANASTAARRSPPKRRPARVSPSRQTRSHAIDVACAARRRSHFPDQPKAQ